LADELMEASVSKAEAFAAARSEFRQLAQKSEESREIRIAGWICDAGQDLRFTFRTYGAHADIAAHATSSQDWVSAAAPLSSAS
jgi:hypothetical protein